jgi:hypothetical protein
LRVYAGWQVRAMLAERLAAALGELVWDWLNGVDGVERFTRQVEPLLARAAPPELAGCQTCPAHCTVLAAVGRVDLAKAGALLAAATPKGTQDAFGSPVTPEQRLGRVIPKLQLIGPPVPADDDLLTAVRTLPVG